MFSFKVLEKISDITIEDWNHVFSSDMIEGYNYYKAVEESVDPSFIVRYAVYYPNFHPCWRRNQTALSTFYLVSMIVLLILTMKLFLGAVTE